jgi:hypothetical protein
VERRTLSGTIQSPPAGQGFSYVFSPNERVLVQSLLVTFTPTNTAGARFVVLQVVDPNGVVIFSSGSGNQQNNGTPATQLWSRKVSNPFTYTDPHGQAFAYPFIDFLLPPAWGIVVSAFNIMAGDQFSAITFAAEYEDDNFDRDRAAAWIPNPEVPWSNTGRN